MRRHPLSILTLALLYLLTAVPADAAQAPRYVFFFIGDGMSTPQIQTTEAYLTTRNGGSANRAADLLKPENRLYQSSMPVLGMQTTYDATSLVTDSASAATALATGVKTESRAIGLDETLTVPVKSIAQLAHEQGMKVGILTTVSLDHATPAGFYASVPHRDLANSIATQLADSGYEFFGGGGLVSPTGPARDGDTGNDVWARLTANGYRVLNDREAILALKDQPLERVVAINPILANKQAMPYALDRTPDSLSLRELTEVAIASLHQPGRDGSGFFLMVEGGKIDWACHANDAVTAMNEVLDFNAAIGAAREFAAMHPGATLIVVTGDHETGGMTVGHVTTAYTGYYERLMGQAGSFEQFASHDWASHEAAYRSGYDWTLPDNLERNPELTGLLRSAFGLDWTALNEPRRARLEAAYDLSMSGTNGYSAEENTRRYGPHEPIVATITRILDETAGIGWTSYVHTGLPVPVFAQGRGAERFAGFYDNTDIARRFAAVMELPELPVPKPVQPQGNRAMRRWVRVSPE